MRIIASLFTAALMGLVLLGGGAVSPNKFTSALNTTGLRPACGASLLATPTLTGFTASKVC
jgi:hypothetical protein